MYRAILAAFAVLATTAAIVPGAHALPNLGASLPLAPQVDGQFVYFAQPARNKSRPASLKRLDMDAMTEQTVFRPSKGAVVRFKAQHGWLAVVVANGSAQATYRVAPDGRIEGPIAGETARGDRCGSGITPLAIRPDGGVIVMRTEWRCDWFVPKVEELIDYRIAGQRVATRVYTGQDHDTPPLVGRLVGEKLLLVSRDLVLVDLSTGVDRRVWRENADDGALGPGGEVWVSTVGATNGGRYWSALLLGTDPYADYSALVSVLAPWRKARHRALVACGDRMLAVHGLLTQFDWESQDFSVRNKQDMVRLKGRIGFDIYARDGSLIRNIPSRVARGPLAMGCTNDMLTIVEIGRRKSRIARIGL